MNLLNREKPSLPEPLLRQLPERALAERRRTTIADMQANNRELTIVRDRLKLLAEIRELDRRLDALDGEETVIAELRRRLADAEDRRRELAAQVESQKHEISHLRAIPALAVSAEGSR